MLFGGLSWVKKEDTEQVITGVVTSTDGGAAGVTEEIDCVC